MSRTTLAEVARNGLIYLVPTALSSLLQFLLLPLYTHYLSPFDYGTISLASAGTLLVGRLACLGTIEASSRLYFKFESDLAALRSFVTTTLLFIVTATSATVLLSTVILPWVSQAMFNTPALGSYALVALCATPFIQATEYMLILLQNSRQAVRYALVRIVGLLITIGLTVLLVAVARKGAMGALLATLAGATATTGSAFVLIRHTIGRVIDRQMLAAALRFGVPLVPYLVGVWIVIWIDRIFLSHLAGLAVAGLYGLAYTLSTAYSLVVNAIIQAWTPMYYQTLEARGEESHPELTHLVTLLIVLFSFGGLALALFSRECIMVMTNQRFHEAYRIVPYLVLYFFIGALNTLLVNNIYFSGKTKWIAPVAFISVAVVIPANLVLIPSLGAIGAAIASILAASVATSLSLLIAQKVYAMRFQYGRIVKATGLAILLFAISSWIGDVPILERLALKFTLLSLFPSGLLALKVLSIADLRHAIHSVRHQLVRARG